MSRTVGPSVMKAMIRIAPPQRGHTSGKNSMLASLTTPKIGCPLVPSENCSRPA